ncbi:hypothetical protein [Vallitalea longa]|nr:hypothetical protein [Vallitalea longa]
MHLITKYFRSLRTFTLLGECLCGQSEHLKQEPLGDRYLLGN